MNNISFASFRARTRFSYAPLSREQVLSRYSAVVTENLPVAEGGLYTLYLQRPLIAGTHPRGQEESRRAFASARYLVIMHRDLPDLDSQGGNWFYNLKRAYTPRNRAALVNRRGALRVPRVLHARFHMRAYPSSLPRSLYKSLSLIDAQCLPSNLSRSIRSSPGLIISSVGPLGDVYHRTVRAPLFYRTHGSKFSTPLLLVSRCFFFVRMMTTGMAKACASARLKTAGVSKREYNVVYDSSRLTALARLILFCHLSLRCSERRQNNANENKREKFQKKIS